MKTKRTNRIFLTQKSRTNLILNLDCVIKINYWISFTFSSYTVFMLQRHFNVSSKVLLLFHFYCHNSKHKCRQKQYTIRKEL